MTINEAKLEEFVGQAVVDMGAVLHGSLVVLGDRLGLYRAMAGAGRITAAQLAERTGTAERYVREWLSAQAASGYVSYAGDDHFELQPEQAEVLANEESPACVLGGFQAFTAASKILPRLVDAFRTGQGVGWHEHDAELFRGVERFFRPGYAANLVGEWLPALDGVVGKLESGGKVADVGCGHGASTVVMADAFPASTFWGFDYHDASIVEARKAAAGAGVGDRVTFEVAPAKQYPGSGYDLVCYFDCLHDMGDPVGAAAHALSTLDPDGTLMIVEPFASDDIADNLNPLGRVYYSASTFICTPASLAQEVGVALGAQAGEERMREVTARAGFTRFRRAAETPVNIIYEARP